MFTQYWCCILLRLMIESVMEFFYELPFYLSLVLLWGYLIITYLFSWYGLYILVLLATISFSYIWRRQKSVILSSLAMSQVVFWIVNIAVSTAVAFEWNAFNFNKTWGFPLPIPFMRVCPTCGSDVPPLGTFPLFLVNWFIFFGLTILGFFFLPKKVLNSKIWQRSIGILGCFAVFLGIGRLGVVYD